VLKLDGTRGEARVWGMSYDDVKLAPVWKFAFGIVILLTFSGTYGIRGYVDGWILSHFEADSFRQFLLIGWKTAVVTASIGVGSVLMYWKLDGPWNSPRKVEKEGRHNSPSARQKAFSEKLKTSLLLVLCLFPLWLFMTFFIIWTP